MSLAFRACETCVLPPERMESRVPRYFFDVNDGRNQRDEVGVECTDLQAAALETKKFLPLVASEEVPKDGERQAITVLVSNEEGHSVYFASLTYMGAWLIR